MARVWCVVTGSACLSAVSAEEAGAVRPTQAEALELMIGSQRGPVLDALEFLRRDLARRGYEYHGLLREVTGALVADALEESGCASCGGEVPRNPTGRPRRFCLECSPRKPRKTLAEGEPDAMATKNGCECRVPIGLAQEHGLSYEFVEAEGVSISPDWAGRPSISVADARRLSEKARAAGEEHQLAWAQFERDRKQWVADRDVAVQAAMREAREDARRRGRGEGQVSASAREAGRQAGEQYERTTPRPQFGDLPASKTAPLAYLTEDDLSPKGLLKLAERLTDRAGVA